MRSARLTTTQHNITQCKRSSGGIEVSQGQQWMPREYRCNEIVDGLLRTNNMYILLCVGQPRCYMDIPVSYMCGLPAICTLQLWFSGATIATIAATFMDSLHVH